MAPTTHLGTGIKNQKEPHIQDDRGIKKLLHNAKYCVVRMVYNGLMKMNLTWNEGSCGSEGLADGHLYGQ